MNKQVRRSRSGSTFVLVILTICLVLVPLLMVCSQLGLYSVDRTRVQNVVEAAGLLAANDLSRLVISDPNFGYVSLSNYPPIGREVCAPDGEPLPVTGINTLVGTVREDTIIANHLANRTMCELAEYDGRYLDETISSLNGALSDILNPGKDVQWRDIYGDKIEVAKDVTAFLKANLPAGMKLESVRLANGWLDGGGTSATPIPVPVAMACVKPTDVLLGEYKPFVEHPVGGRKFTFAGLGASSTIVSPRQFRPADRRHISSIVRVECVISYTRGALMLGTEPVSKMSAVACCQPFSLEDSGPSGVMALHFSGAATQGLQFWSDFLKESGFSDRQVNTYDSVGGDYPLDSKARMRRVIDDCPPTTAQQFAGHLYYWLRNGHLHPRIDSVLQMVNEPLRTGTKEFCIYEFAKDGSIFHRYLSKDPFPVGVTGESQLTTIVDTRIQSGATPLIIFRNYVRNLGLAAGGKHCGQPLAGTPLNWCELSEYGGDEQQACSLGKGRKGTGLAIVDNSGSAIALGDQVRPGGSFRTMDFKSLVLQPRRSYYSGGLALEIEIGGMQISTAMADVTRMRNLKR